MKRALLLFTGILICLHGIAQTIGVRVGANLAHQSSKYVDFEDSPPTMMVYPHLGITVNNEYSKKTSFQFELSCSVVGARGFHMVYGAVGFFIKQHFNRKFNVHLGPQLGFLISEYYRVNRMDINLGLGVEWYATPHVGLGLRYQRGLSNLISNPDNTEATLRNHALQFSILFRFTSRQFSELGY